MVGLLCSLGITYSYYEQATPKGIPTLPTLQQELRARPKYRAPEAVTSVIPVDIIPFWCLLRLLEYSVCSRRLVRLLVISSNMKMWEFVERAVESFCTPHTL